MKNGLFNQVQAIFSELKESCIKIGNGELKYQHPTGSSEKTKPPQVTKVKSVAPTSAITSNSSRILSVYSYVNLLQMQAKSTSGYQVTIQNIASANTMPEPVKSRGPQSLGES